MTVTYFKNERPVLLGCDNNFNSEWTNNRLAGRMIISKHESNYDFYYYFFYYY